MSLKLWFMLALLSTYVARAGEMDLRGTPEVSSAIRLLENWISAQIEYRSLPGLAIAVVHDTALVWSRGFGFADLEKRTPVTPETIFRMASITKTFTSTAIMQLRDAGKLQLDDPVAKHLAWFQYKNRFPEGPIITIRQLLMHTSGLPREAAFPYWTDHKFPSREELIGAFRNQESVYEPETHYKYSNLGMAILGEVVAAVSGDTYEEYIRTHILDPLGMSNTSVFPRGQEMHRLVTGYGRRLPDGSRQKSPFTDSKGLAAAANISSTADDMARYAAFHMQEETTRQGQILRASTLREMHRVHWINPNWKSGRGLGFSVAKSEDRVTFGHGGWVAGNRTQLLISPAEKLAVIVLTNADDASPALFAGTAMRMLAPAIRKVLPRPAAEQEPDSSLGRYVGRYSDPWGWDTDIMVYNEGLVMYEYSYPPDENPVGSLTELTPEGEHTFRMTGENGNGELVLFEFGSDGKVRRVKVGENYIYPVEV